MDNDDVLRAGEALFAIHYVLGHDVHEDERGYALVNLRRVPAVSARELEHATKVELRKHSSEWA